VSAVAIRALEERKWVAESKDAAELRWAIILRWADDMYSTIFDEKKQGEEKTLKRE
jgi:hypothetical protein